MSIHHWTKPLICEMKTFSDNVSFTQIDIDYLVLRDLERKYDITLDNFVPFKSGMVSLVFKGRQNNRQIVIKLQRTNIHTKITNALNQIQNFIKLFEYFKTPRTILQTYKIQDLFDINKQTLLSQLNFKLEVLNTIQIKENCKNLKYVVIPQPITEITHEFPTVIVMDFISGVCLNNVEPEDSFRFAKQLIKFGIVTSVIHGCLHGDFHCGNVIFIKDECDVRYPHKIGVIDFGIICRIQKNFKQSLLTILSNIFTQPSHKSAIQIMESGVFEPLSEIHRIPKTQYDNIACEIAKIIESAVSPNTTVPVDIFNIIEMIRGFYFHMTTMHSNMLSKYHIYPSKELLNLQSAIAMAHGPTFSLCGEKYKEVLIASIEELFHLSKF
jgi:predicted unusual protein kinase regulating ubiquinone biosynthesis (AarF/ABC1/UbiB family)